MFHISFPASFFCYPNYYPKNNHHVPLKSIATTHGHPSMAWQRIQSLPQTGLCDGEPTTSVAMSLNSRSFQHLPSHPTHPASPLYVGLLDGMLPLSLPVDPTKQSYDILHYRLKRVQLTNASPLISASP